METTPAAFDRPIPQADLTPLLVDARRTCLWSPLRRTDPDFIGPPQPNVGLREIELAQNDPLYRQGRYPILRPITSSFLLHSFSCLIHHYISLWHRSFCPPTYLFCYLLLSLFHRIPHTMYIRSGRCLIFLLSATTRKKNPVLTLGFSAFQTFSLDVCIFLFLLGAPLMMTSPTSNRCCDTHRSPAMTHISYNLPIRPPQQQVVDCTHCATRCIGGQFIVLSLKRCVRHNQFHCITKSLTIRIFLFPEP